MTEPTGPGAPAESSSTIHGAKGLFLIHGLTSGGAERVAIRVAAYLRTQSEPGDYRFALLSNSIEYEVPEGVEVHVISGPSQSFLAKGIGFFRRFFNLVHLVRAYRPETVVSFMPKSNFLNIMGKLLIRDWPRVILTEHNSISLNYRGMPRSLFMRMLIRLYSKADRVVAVSSLIASELAERGVPAERIQVINNPVDGAEIREMARTGEAHSWTLEADPVIVAVGRLTPQKGYPVLLRALSIARATRRLRLVVFGVGELRDQLAAETARLGLSDAVDWAGFSSNPFPTIRAAQAYVMPSLWEGFPVALLEAMALEQAVIATDCPGASGEMVQGGKSGILVPPSDPTALAKAILTVVSDPELRKDLGARARARAAEYPSEEVFRRYQAVMHGNLE